MVASDGSSGRLRERGLRDAGCHTFGGGSGVTQDQKALLAHRLTLVATLSPLVSGCCLMGFFGGSARDPMWVWMLFYIIFFGGFAVSLLALLCLVILKLFVKPEPVLPPPIVPDRQDENSVDGS